MTTSVQRTRWRRTASRCLVAAAVTALGLAVVGAALRPVEAQGGGPRPEVFRSSASALVAEISVDRDALLPVPDVLRFMVAEGRGTYETSNQTAQASLFYPGNGVISGPNLLCDTFGDQFPPEFQPVLDACLAFDYPLTVRADSFLEPERVSEGAVQLGDPGDPVSVQGVRAAATAAPEATVTESVLSSLQVLGFPDIGALAGPLGELLAPVDPSVVTIEGATSLTSQHIDDDGTLVVEARSTLGGVRLVGGLIEIGSVRATAVVTDDGRGTVTHEADLEIGGVTVAGLPARISADGLELVEPMGFGIFDEQVVDLVNSVVDGLEVNVTALEVADGVDEHGSAFALVSGILIEFERDIQGLPTIPGPMGEIDLSGLYRGGVLLGQAGAVGQAAYIDAPPFEPAVSPSPPEAAGDPAAPPATSTAQGVVPPGSPATNPADGTATAPIAPELIRVTSFEHLIEGRLRLVYLAIALAALGLAIAPRFTFSARLPGAS